MNIWLIHLGELLPIDGKVRLSRYSVLAEMLSSSGHNVTRWAPTFVHLTKTYRAKCHQNIEINEKYRICLLHVLGYKKHVGLGRYLFHRRFAHNFTEQAERHTKPDIILCAMPTPNMCQTALNYGVSHHVPVVIDIRDLWPDALLDRFPRLIRFLLSKALFSMHKQNHHIFKQATAITGISQHFLNWGLQLANQSADKKSRVYPMAIYKNEPSQIEREKAATFWNDHNVYDNKQLRCCFFGTMASLFDLETVIEAAKIISLSNEKPWQFILCGNGPNLEHYRTLAKNLKNVIFPGWVGSAEVTLLMERSVIGLAPYNSGVQSTIPNKVVDYFSAGLPVVCTSDGELAEVIERYQCGLSYKPCDVNGLVTTLNKLGNSEKTLEQFGNNAEQFFNKKLSADCVYSDMIDFLEKLTLK